MQPPPLSAIIGCSSGIGRALLELHRARGLPFVAFSHKPESCGLEGVVPLDLRAPEAAHAALEKSFAQNGPFSRVFLVSGTGDLEPDLAPAAAVSTISLNCSGFATAAYTACSHFEKSGAGQLIAVTSVAAIRGGSTSPSYHASKAFQSSLLEGLRCRYARKGLPIYVTEIRAGFVDTALMKADKPFWVATPETAARQILRHASYGTSVAYVTARWRLVGALLYWMPRFLHARIG